MYQTQALGIDLKKTKKNMYELLTDSQISTLYE